MTLQQRNCNVAVSKHHSYTCTLNPHTEQHKTPKKLAAKNKPYSIRLIVAQAPQRQKPSEKTTAFGTVWQIMKYGFSVLMVLRLRLYSCDSFQDSLPTNQLAVSQVADLRTGECMDWSNRQNV